MIASISILSSGRQSQIGPCLDFGVMSATCHPLRKVRFALLHKSIAHRSIFTLAEVDLLRSGCMFDLTAKLVDSTVWPVSTKGQFIVADVVAQGVLERAFIAQDLAAFLAGQGGRCEWRPG